MEVETETGPRPRLEQSTTQVRPRLQTAEPAVARCPLAHAEAELQMQAYSQPIHRKSAKAVCNWKHTTRRISKPLRACFYLAARAPSPLDARTAHAHAMLMHAVKVELHNHRPHTTPNTTRSTRARALAFATSTCCHAPRRHTRHRGPCHAPKRRAGQAAASANARRLSLGRSPRACAKGIARLGLALLKETVAVQYRAGGRASETRGAHERRGSFIRGMHASGMPMPVFFS